jgi:hypothetical protein
MVITPASTWLRISGMAPGDALDDVLEEVLEDDEFMMISGLGCQVREAHGGAENIVL